MSRFRSSLGYGVLDQVVARVFDLGALWVVTRTLPDQDLAVYGVASAMLFMFTLVLVVPEVALLRDKKRWALEGTLREYLSGFVLFAELRIAVVGLAALVVGALTAWHSAYFFACVIALVNQLVQLAELTRIDFRVDLHQRQVFRAELALKALLLAAVLFLFVRPGLGVYLALFLGWAVASALFWSWRLRRKHGIGFHLRWSSLRYAWTAMRDFSLWQHLSGVVTYVVYNVDPWVLSRYAPDTATVSTYTVALKVSALFFTVPMFLQSMVTIFLVNCADEGHKRRTFRKMFLLNGALAAAQLVGFLVAGRWIGRFFRGGALDTPLFYDLGVILCVGVFLLNVTRPLIADLVLHAPMARLVGAVYLPVLLFALTSYVALTATFGATGCALASALSYALFAALLVWQTARHGVTRAALFPAPIPLNTAE